MEVLDNIYDGMHYVVCYSETHYVQAEYLRGRCENLRIIGPTQFAPDIEFPADFDPGTFSTVVKSRFVEEVVQQAALDQCQWLWITCLNFPFSNILAGEITSNHNVRIIGYYDGLVNLIMAKVTWKTRTLDFLKFLYARIHKRKFTARKEYLSGCDLHVMNQFVYPPYLYYQAAMDLKKEKLQPSLKKRLTNSKDRPIVLILSLLNSAIGPEAIGILRNTVDQARRMFAGHDVRVLTKPGAPILDEYAELEEPRSSDRESAEELILRIQPSAVISQVSSALVNLRIVGFQGSICACRTAEYFGSFETEQKSLYQQIYKKYEIEILS